MGIGVEVTDVEVASVGGGSSSRQQRQAVVDNPFSNHHPEALTQKRFIDKGQRILYIIISAYALHYFKFYGVILRSPHVRHEWFKIGLAFTIGQYSILYGLLCGSFLLAQIQSVISALACTHMMRAYHLTILSSCETCLPY